MICPTPTSDGSILSLETPIPLSVAYSKEEDAATAEARKCSYRVFSKLVTTLTFPGL
jgi:hypothetical protein